MNPYKLINPEVKLARLTNQPKELQGLPLQYAEHEKIRKETQALIEKYKTLIGFEKTLNNTSTELG